MNSDGPPSREDPRALSRIRDLHALIDTVPDAMIVIDTSANILSFSKGAERMFGFAEADVLEENVSLLMASPHRERHDGYISHYIETGEKRIIGTGRVTTARRRDGTTFPISLTVGELSLDGRRVFAGVICDLTETKETERQLHSLQADLAHVSRITSMGTLATSIAHELNQPLTVIANYVQTVRDMLHNPQPGDSETIREALDECARETLRAGEIVRRLRDFISRGETTRQIVSLRRLIGEATALALINGDVRNVDVQTQLGTQDDLVLVDPIQIQQVIVNLLRNALEAMEGTRVKQLAIKTEDCPGNMIRVTVSDSGPGLDAQVAEKLFHPFNSTKPSGMGLGLSICHTIITAHQGKIWVGPSDLGGTAFNFTLMSAKVGDDDE